MTPYLIIGALSCGLIGAAVWLFFRGTEPDTNYLELTNERMAMLVDAAYRESL